MRAAARRSLHPWARTPSLLGALALAACSCGGSDAERASGEAAAAPTSAGSGSESAEAGAYDVHEWGLVRALPGDVLSAGVIGPPRAALALSVDKPVLYFHTEGPLTLRSVDLDAGGGSIAEVWPDPLVRTGMASRLTWTDVALDPTGACPPSPLPTLGDPPCALLPAGEMCEVASLATVRVPGVACVRTAGVVDSFLFYRARTRAFTPPLRFERSASAPEDVTVTNEGTLPIPGWLVRLSDSYGSVRALAVRPPAPGASIVVGANFAAASAAGLLADETMLDMPAMPGSPEPGRRALLETMTGLGMTEGEADAFFRAWDMTLFGLAPALDRPIDVLTADDRSSGDEDGDFGPVASFVYFLPEASVDGIARVTFDPPPRTFRRAMAVWSPILGAGASH